MSQAKFAAARELIQERQYAAARAVLVTIPDDPKAREWITKIDQLTPPAPASRPRRNYAAWLITLIAVFVAVGSLSVLIVSRLDAGSASDLDRMVNSYCNLWGSNSELCTTERASAGSNADIQACFAASGEGQSVEAFNQCMLMRSISIRTPFPTPDLTDMLESVTGMPLLEFMQPASTTARTPVMVTSVPPTFTPAG